jgi:hypothetical protein
MIKNKLFVAGGRIKIRNDMPGINLILAFIPKATNDSIMAGLLTYSV